MSPTTPPSEQFGYDDAARARDLVIDKLRDRGLDAEKVQDGVILGSGLGGFPDDHMHASRRGHADGPLVIPFGEILDALEAPTASTGVQGHAHELVIGPLSNTDESRLVVAQSGREHPYERVPMQRSVFWLRVMQLLGVKTLFGSNAAGIVTPRTLGIPSLMLVNSDREAGTDNPLVGPNDDRFGERFQHMNDKYPQASRDLVKAVAARLGIPLAEGLLFREMGPSYESPETILELRGRLRTIWREAQDQRGEDRFRYSSTGDPTGMVGMSSTFEHTVVQHAAYSRVHPAFYKGRAHVGVATNYAAGMGPDGFVPPPNHEEVKTNAKLVQDQFGRLAREVILEWRKAA
ncbi:purine-nucleoside phosphorylase [Candidatus Peregrinibacteria bacterium]|nr:purine-nucleoside phosphorylase [Candidatus Peregrinibacteria bacterium]